MMETEEASESDTARCDLIVDTDRVRRLRSSHQVRCPLLIFHVTRSSRFSVTPFASNMQRIQAHSGRQRNSFSLALELSRTQQRKCEKGEVLDHRSAKIRASFQR